MYEHHQRVIARLTEQIKTQPEYLALIIGGSLVRGWGRPDSDIDILLVVSPERYQERKAEDNLLYYDTEICDYEGGYIDGKILDINYLNEAAEKGNEPTRAAFVNAIVAFSHLPELEPLIRKIATYPEAEREAKIRSFHSEVQMMRHYFIKEAVKRQDDYLMTRSVADLVLFAGRLILAENRILYPYHKWLMRQLREVPNKPENFVELLEDALRNPGEATAAAVYDSLNSMRDWGVEFREAVAYFMRDREQHWRNGPAPIHDW